MAEAEASPIHEFEKGNHRIRYSSPVFQFFYRGTLIYTWNSVTEEGIVVRGDFEDSPATIHQRKEIQRAIKDYKEVKGI